MARVIELGESPRSLADYEAVAHLAPAVRELCGEAAPIARELEGRTLWMVNSTERGGGVAEMLPGLVTLLRELGVRTEWVVLESEEPGFFELTKRLHNLIHGTGDPGLGAGDREIYERVNRANAELLRARMRPGDILAVHDPQPMPLAAILREELDLVTLWRCHIGLDEDNAQTRAAWEFLAPYADAYDHAVFSAPEYIPDPFARRSSLIYPALDPLAAKNRDIHLHELVEILCDAMLAAAPSPLLRSQFFANAKRLQPDGRFAVASAGDDIGLLTRPIITQVSRWDRLKGFLPLVEAFALLKARLRERYHGVAPVHRRRLKLARLVCAGPDPSSVADDPEEAEVLEALREAYLRLDPIVQDDVAIISLPMESDVQNALMVNALQRSSTVVVQNSLREGFGLTIAEAMWKRIPVLSNAKACGPRQQLRDGLDGRLIEDPEDVSALADCLDEVLADGDARDRWGRSAQRRAHDKFLVFSQLSSWLSLLGDLVARRHAS
jgi:trehalose synthase